MVYLTTTFIVTTELWRVQKAKVKERRRKLHKKIFISYICCCLESFHFLLFPSPGISMLSPYHMAQPKHTSNPQRYKNSANLYAHLQLIVVWALCIHHPA